LQDLLVDTIFTFSDIGVLILRSKEILIGSVVVVLEVKTVLALVGVVNRINPFVLREVIAASINQLTVRLVITE
jgi:hypothetical protein